MKRLSLSISILLIITYFGYSEFNYMEIVGIKGQIRYKDNNTNKVLILNKSNKIYAYSKVKIDKGGYLKCKTPKNDILTFSNKGYFKVGKLAFSESNSSLNINLYKGKLNCVVTKLKANSNFTIKTPSAIAGVKGTSFDVAVDDTENTTVSVSEGSVAVQDINGTGEPQLITEGKSVTVDNSGDMEVGNNSSEQNNQTNSENENNSEQENNTVESNQNETTQQQNTETTNEIQSVVEQQQDEKEVEKLINLKLRVNDKD
jgi:hypothetical protein